MNTENLLQSFIEYLQIEKNSSHYTIENYITRFTMNFLYS